MTYIEGFGDEVTHFLAFLIIVVLCFIAWWSTGTRDVPHVRTVILLERRGTQTEGQTPVAPNSQEPPPPEPVPTGDVPQSSPPSQEEGGDEARSREDPQEEVKKQRFKFFQNRLRPANFGAAPANETPPPTEETTEGPDPSAPNQQEGEEEGIRIRLKYLNDDQRLVHGRLQEPLGDFKKRHFRVELSNQKLIRLIFNGQVLQSDEQSLQRYGLYDNCVVHCLVQNQQTGNRQNTQINASPPEWNLGFILYTLISAVLGLAWVMRYQYSHLFSLTSTAFLVGLTMLFGVFLGGAYLPDNAEPVPPAS
jgi:hypothetical protein